MNTGDEFFLAIYTELPTIAQHVTTLGYIPGCFTLNGSENQSMCVPVCALMILDKQCGTLKQQKHALSAPILIEYILCGLYPIIRDRNNSYGKVQIVIREVICCLIYALKFVI